MSALLVATGYVHAPPPERVTTDVPFIPQAQERKKAVLFTKERGVF